jgi:DNA-binding CsgD family transcriptional regulator
MTAMPLPVRPAVLSAPAAIDAALAAAGREVLVARTTGTDPAGPLRRADHDNLRRGVRYRVLLPESIRRHPAVVLRLGRLVAAGAQVRTVGHVPADVTVIDGELAMLARDRSAGDVAVVGLPGVVDTVVALFERLWPSALPLTSGDDHLGARERELLALLSAGCTDETAAAHMGVSVRTVRRMMSAIMLRLGARSRFQAGLRAADRGLLMPIP